MDYDILPRSYPRPVRAMLYMWLILGLMGFFAFIFAFYDLDISKALYDPSATWAQFLGTYGEWPGYFLIGVAVVGLVQHRLIEKRAEWSDWDKIFLVIIILGIINPLVFVTLTKLFWGRVRFVDLATDYSNFTPWYCPQWIQWGHFSFTSGHTAMAWMLLPLTIYFRKKPGMTLFIIPIVAWGALVSYSRIVVGAHYASDILFPTFLAFLLTFMLYLALFEKFSWTPKRFGEITNL